VFIVSAIVSIWVLASARKRFALWISLLWALGSFLLTLVIFPLYLISMLFRPARPGLTLRWRFVLPAVYGILLFGYVGGKFYRDTQSVDARLARATAANLVNDKKKQIQEYRKALQVEDDPYVHKLLGVALLEDDSYSEAITELKLAEMKGDTDDAIPYWLALSMEKLNQKEQARMEYQRFLLTRTCLKPDTRCESARHQIKVVIE
jgi:tetratricopeptide (TPR) repeat protein